MPDSRDYEYILISDVLEFMGSEPFCRFCLAKVGAYLQFRARNGSEAEWESFELDGEGGEIPPIRATAPTGGNRVEGPFAGSPKRDPKAKPSSPRQGVKNRQVKQVKNRRKRSR